MCAYFSWTRNLLPGLLVGLLVLVAVGCDGVGVSEGDVRADGNSFDVAGKVYEFADQATTDYKITLKYVGPADYRESYSVVLDDGSTYTGPATLFHYKVAVPSNSTHLALQDPQCATFLTASGATTDNNSNGEVEWHSGLSTDHAAPSDIWYAFVGNVPEGAVEASAKYSSNLNRFLGPIGGPCRGVSVVDGHVFVERAADPATPAEYTPGIDAGIGGLGIVVNGTTTTSTDGDGYYRAESYRPWYPESGGVPVYDPFDPSVPSTYGKNLTYQSEGTSTASVFCVECDALKSSALFSDVYPSPWYNPQTVSLGLSPAETADWGYRLDIQSALDGFESNTVESDGLPRTFWRVQATGKGTVKYRPVIGVWWDWAPVATRFGQIADIRRHLGEVLNSSGTSFDLSAMAEILKQSSTNDEYLGLKTSVLTLALNYSWYRGICENALPLVQPPNANDYPRCAPPPTGPYDPSAYPVDEAATYIVLEQAIGLLNDMQATGPGKAPTGTTKSVVDCTNNEC